MNPNDTMGHVYIVYVTEYAMYRVYVTKYNRVIITIIITKVQTINTSH